MLSCIPDSRTSRASSPVRTLIEPFHSIHHRRFISSPTVSSGSVQSTLHPASGFLVTPCYPCCDTIIPPCCCLCVILYLLTLFLPTVARPPRSRQVHPAPLSAQWILSRTVTEDEWAPRFSPLGLFCLFVSSFLLRHGPCPSMKSKASVPESDRRFDRATPRSALGGKSARHWQASSAPFARFTGALVRVSLGVQAAVATSK